MAKRSNEALREWAVIGAEARLLEIAAEAAKIFHAFPELRGRGFMAPEAGRREGREPSPGGVVRRRRRLSAAGRKAISDAARARWARQRNARATGKKR